MIYVQSQPTTCCNFICDYAAEAAWISIGGSASTVAAVYNAGGRHRNDWIQVTYQGRDYTLNHSSFGFGFRVCQPPDCLQVYDHGTGDLIEDGCTTERTLPIVCVNVEEDGSVPELVDTFAPCPGDPNLDAG